MTSKTQQMKTLTKVTSVIMGSSQHRRKRKKFGENLAKIGISIPFGFAKLLEGYPMEIEILTFEQFGHDKSMFGNRLNSTNIDTIFGYDEKR
jgi:hypothetical protein